MTTGAINQSFDVAQIVLYAFWIFFIALVIYLRREDKREGYPLASSRSERSGGRVKVVGFPAPPPPKTFRLPDGTSISVPDPSKDTGMVSARALGATSGSPLEPVGDPMQARVGPGAVTPRANTPDLTLEGQPRIVPMRAADGFGIATPDSDPRGMPVLGADGAQGGTVRDLWVDLAEPQVRYLEVEAGGRRVLVPITLARIDTAARAVRVASVLGRQLRDVPGISSPDRITRAEEEQVSAYFGAGTLYAEPSRVEPWL